MVFKGITTEFKYIDLVLHLDGNGRIGKNGSFYFIKNDSDTSDITTH